MRNYTQERKKKTLIFFIKRHKIKEWVKLSKSNLAFGRVDEDSVRSPKNMADLLPNNIWNPHPQKYATFYILVTNNIILINNIDG